MPSLGADMEAGTLAQWLKRPGEEVKRGDIVAVVETQKGAIEIEIFEDGVLEQHLVEPGAEVPVGTPLATVRGTGEPAEPSPPRPAAGAAPSPPRPQAVAPARPAQPPVAVPATGIQASPAARKLAAERGVDLSKVKGGGPGGAIVRADVEAAAGVAGPAEGAPTPRGFDFSQMRAAIAAAMSRSKREIPHYYLSDTVDVGAAVRWVADLNGERPPERRLLIGALFVKATALAARQFPEMNGAFEDGTFRPNPAVHAGVAISIRGGGLVAPAIHDADRLALDDLMAAMRDLIARVRAGRFKSSEIADPTITVSSLGERGVETLYGVIYPPQVAILGFGKVLSRPWAVGDAVGVRPVTTLTLAADHRVSDGHRGALFLARIGELLQTPEAL